MKEQLKKSKGPLRQVQVALYRPRTLIKKKTSAQTRASKTSRPATAGTTANCASATRATKVTTQTLKSTWSALIEKKRTICLGRLTSRTQAIERPFKRCKPRQWLNLCQDSSSSMFKTSKRSASISTRTSLITCTATKTSRST